MYECILLTSTCLSAIALFYYMRICGHVVDKEGNQAKVPPGDPRQRFPALGAASNEAPREVHKLKPIP